MLVMLVVNDEHVYATFDYIVMICYPWLWNGNLDICEKKYEMLILIWMFKCFEKLKLWNYAIFGWRLINYMMNLLGLNPFPNAC